LSKKSQIFIIILIGISLISLNFNYATASDDDDDGIDDDFEDLNKRNISIEIETDQIQIESSLRSGDQIDGIQIKITNDSEGLGIEVSYESEINSTEFELEFGIRFRKLVEFVDIGNNSIYDSLIDDTIQDFDLDDFQPVIYNQFNITEDTALHYFIINTTDGVFAAHIYFSEEFYIVNGTLITPVQMKIDIEISNFPYINASSQIALYTSLESEIDYEEEEDTEDEISEYATNEKGVITKINNFTGFFTWKNNASIDGISREVLVSDLDIDDYDEDEQKIYLTYPRGAQIYHDPKVGIEGILKFKSIVDNPSFLIVLIAIISSLSISIGIAGYHYRERIFTSHYTELEIKKDIGETFSNVKYDSKRLDALLDNKRLLHQLKDLSSDKMSNIEDIEATALSEDFFKIIDTFDWEEDDLIEFIREMISLSPEERDAVFKEMINKSEQQKKNRLDDTKRLYT
jgi:hypothetical protein